MLELRGAISAIREGQNGRLFLGRQDGFDLDLFTSGNPFPPHLLAQWHATLTRRGEEMAARGKIYVFFIVPDAPSVHPQDLPAELQARFRPPGDVFLEAMGDIPNVMFVYPRDAMCSAIGGLDVYKKKDSHWTTYGSYVAYRALMARLQGLVPCTIVPARDIRFTLRRSFGDLGVQAEPEQYEDIPAHSMSGPDVERIVTLQGVGRQTGAETYRQTGGPTCRALFFRDSYMTDLAPYLARSFSHFLTLGTTTRVMLDAVDEWEADLVVSQVAERKLFFCETDHQLESYATIFGANFDGPAGARLLKALLLRGEDPTLAASLVADDDADLAADPVHAFSLALIHEAAGHIDMARAFVEQADRARPEQPSFLALLARIDLASGEIGRAVDLARRAADIAPYNGYFHELHCYSLVQAHSPGAALRVAQSALGRIKDSANLWYWSSVCQQAAGRTEAAVGDIRCALQLAPDNPSYSSQYNKLMSACVN